MTVSKINAPVHEIQPNSVVFLLAVLETGGAGVGLGRLCLQIHHIDGLVILYPLFFFQVFFLQFNHLFQNIF